MLNSISTEPANPNAPNVIRVTPNTGVQVDIPVQKFLNNVISNNLDISKILWGIKVLRDIYSLI